MGIFEMIAIALLVLLGIWVFLKVSKFILKLILLVLILGAAVLFLF